MKNFSVVQEHFRKLRCAHCNEAFTPEGVKLLREEKDYWVVRVHCTECNQPAGVAIVGVEYDSNEAPAPAGENAREAVPSGQGAATRIRGIFSSRREEEKFNAMPPISQDEVIDAHRFFSDLGNDWMSQLPKKAR